MKKLLYTLFFITIGLICPAVVFSQTITGTVFQDINFNGTKDAADPGIGGVIVKAYDDNDPIATPTATATTAATGAYTLTGLAAATKYRLEISNPNSWLFPGPNGTGSQTTVRIATTGATNANFGLVLPTDYCQAVPDVIVPCFVSGNPLGGGTAGSEYSLAKFGYNNSGTSGSMSHLATAKKTGTVWGVAYQRETKKVFTSAFLKRHSGIGPGGLGAIYIGDVNTLDAISVYANLSTLGVTLAAPADLTYINSTRNGTLPSVSTSSSQDAQVFPLIGKVGMGGMDLSTNGDTLWIVNLYEKKLIRILLGNPHKASLTASDVTQYSIPDPGCASGSWRPWAVRHDKGKVYVGGVCDAGTAGARSNLRAYVYTFNPVTNTFNGTPVIQYPLDYTKGATHTGDAAIGKNWEPWRDTWADMFKGGVLSAGTRTARPQPILSDIDFDESGNMLMTFTDRGGHQLGVGQQAIPSDGKAYNGYISGDMLIAKNNGNTFTLENNGAITGKTGNGVGNGQGPGGGEFFANDLYPVSGSVIHQETVIGASLILPGKNEVMTISMDPLGVWTGGVNVSNLTNGVNVRRYQIYSTGPGANGSQGKANGLGLTAPGCDPAPIEIGNVIWLDSDSDGVQDPGEAGIAGITVELRKADNTLVSTAVTDANGFYLFSNATGTSTGSSKYGLTGLTYFTAYKVVVPNAAGGSKQSGLGTNVLTQNDTGGVDALADLRDSDGTLSGNNAQTANFTTGSGAMNNHTFDFGFKPFVAPQPPTPCTLISGLNSNLTTVCDDARSINFTITHDATLIPSQTMKLVYSTTALTAAQLYSGSGTTLSSGIAPVTGQTSKLVTASMPTNGGASPVSYFVYVVFETAPADPTCRPFGLVSPITVNPQVAPATLSGTYFEICDRDDATTPSPAIENVKNLNSLVSGNTNGVWTVSGSPTMSGTFTGGIFTAAQADAGKTFTFTYTLTGTGPAGSACATKTYTVTIKVNACPCYETRTICGTEDIDASVPSGYTVTWYKENGATDIQVGNPGDDLINITTTGEYYYTGTDANGCPVELCCHILVTQNTLPAVINTTQQTICNVNRPSTAAADNAIDLDNQFVSGNTGGTWGFAPSSPVAVGTLGAGNVFTAAQADAGKTLIFRYTIVGVGGCPNLIYDVPVLVNSCECPTFTGIVTPGPVCSDEKYSITLNHTEAPLGGNVEFYYSTVGGLVAADLYAPFHGGATLIGTSSIGTNGSTTINNVQLPASGQSITYYIYAIYVPSPAIPGCQPFFLPPATVTVQGPTVPATVSAPAPLCNVSFGNNDNVFNLMTLVTGNTTGTWSSANATANAAISGNVFTATAGMAGQTFTLIYTVQGASGSQTSACGDIVYTMDITIKDCSCPSVDILTTSGTPSTVCSDGTFSVTINHRANPGNLQLYYIEDAGNDGTELTAAQLYSAGNGGATALGGVISPTSNVITTTVSGLSLPVNTSGVAKNYIIYVRLAAGNSNINNPNCQPISQKLITTLPQTPTATLTSTAEVCESSYSTNLNKINLNSLITAGFTGGTWIDTGNSGGLSGSTFTASPAMAGTNYTFTYKINGVGTGNCGDQTYNVTVSVKNCAVPCGTISSITPTTEAICSDSPFSVTIQHTADIGEMSIYWGESTAYGDYEFYTDGFDDADVHFLGNVTPASSGATTTTATGLTLPIYNGLSRDIYLYVVLKVGNSKRVIPFCIPYAYNTMQQDPALQASAGTDGNTSVCDNSTTAINLFGLITGETAGGTWTRETGTGGTFDANAGTFTPAPGATTSTFKYTIAGALSCPGDESIATVNISAYKTAGTDGNTAVCDNSNATINLFDLITGEATGGVWTRTTGTGGTFNAATGTFTPALGATTSTFTYTITGTAPCPNDESVATVNISAYKTAGTDGNTAVCDNSNATINLFDLITGEATGGVWTRTGGTGGTFNAATGTFIPALGATTSTFTYTITGTAPCPNDESIATVNISAYKTAGTDGNTAVCDNSTTAINLFSLITGEDAGGVWTRTGGTGGTFNAAAGTFIPATGATTSTFTYTITGTAPCPNDESIATVTVTPYKTAGVAGSTTVCSNSTTPINLFDVITGESFGGVWIRLQGTGGTFDEAAGTFTPSATTTSSTFQYEIREFMGCPRELSIATVNISAYKTAGTDGNTAVCDNSTTAINLFNLITGEATGGVWTRTSGTGGTFNAATGTFTPALGATTSTFKYSITGTAPCPNEESVATVDISAYKTAGAAGNMSVCDNSTTAINLFDLITGESLGGVWTRTSGTGGTFNAAAGTFIPASGATTSTFKYSITGTAPCPNEEAIATVNISAFKTAGTDGNTSVCDYSATPINLFSLITGEDAGGVWTRVNGTGGTFNAAAGTFTPASGATTSTFAYSFEAIAPCNGDFSIVTVNITPKPVASIVPKTNVMCTNSGSPTFTASPASGVTYEWYGPLSDTTSSLGTALSNTVANFTPTVAQTNYIGIRYFAVIVKTTGASICSDTAFVQLKINPKPVVTPSSLTVCENTPGSGLGTFNLSSLNSTVGGSNSVSWFSNKERTTSINLPAAYISTTAKAYARVTILETGCSDTTSVSLTVQGKPVQINAETSCVATSNGSGKIVVTATAPAGGSLEYKLGITGAYGSTATFNTVLNGNHTVYVRVVGTNCYDSTIVNINCFCTQPILTVVDPAPVCSPMTVNITSNSVITINTGIRTNYWKNAALTQPLDATTGPATAIKSSGTYYIKSMLSDSTCYVAKAVEVKINPLPVVKDTSLALCDLGNGKAVFNLLLAEGAVKGMTNNTVSWFSNAGRTVAITTPSAYLSGNNKVYVRVTNTTTNCSDTTSVNLIVYPKPNAGPDFVGGAAICNTVATIDLPNAAQGSSWSQLGNSPKTVTINSTTGVVTGMDAIGTYRFILKNTTTGCADTVLVETKNCLKGSIGDYVWKDLNDNGLQDSNEPGVKGVIVQLLNANTGGLLKTDTTDNNGVYSFTGLEDGNYKVKIVLSSLPADCQLSTRQDAGGVNDDAKDSDFGPTGESPVVVINTLGTGLAKDNPTIDAALIKTCIQPTWQVTSAPICSPTAAVYSVSFSVTNQNGTLKVNKGTLSGSNPYTVTGIPNGVNLVITDSLRANCKFQNTIVSPDCSCPQISLVNPNATACKGDTLPTLKVILVGSNTNGVGANWYAASSGGNVLGTGLTFKPSGTITATTTFYVELTGTTGACLNQPRTPVTVTALDCKVDLALKKSISTKIAQIGDVLTYTLKVWNQSGSNASGVEVTDSIAITSQFQSNSFVASRGSASISNSVIKWTIGSIVANGDTVTLTYQVKAIQQGLHFNTAEISKINEKDVDSTPGNGTDGEDDIDRQCFTVPVRLCVTEKIQASVPAKYLNVQWFKNGGNTPIASGNTVLLTGEGIYTFTATNNACPAGGCCPIIVEPADNCCPEDLCVPFTIKQTKKAGKPVK